MSDWLEQYCAALDTRDAREQAHKPYIDAYTKLADRTAATNTTPTVPPAPGQTTSSASTPKGPPQEDDILTLRTTLSTTQKARASLQTQLTTLTTQLHSLQTTHSASLGTITQLSKQKADLERKQRDYSDETYTRSKLVTDAQDEMVALQLQLHMAEQRSERLERENRELIERWMAKMGEEAERVNRDSRWE